MGKFLSLNNKKINLIKLISITNHIENQEFLLKIIIDLTIFIGKNKI